MRSQITQCMDNILATANSHREAAEKILAADPTGADHNSLMAAANHAAAAGTMINYLSPPINGVALYLYLRLAFGDDAVNIKDGPLSYMRDQMVDLIDPVEAGEVCRSVYSLDFSGEVKP